MSEEKKTRRKYTRKAKEEAVEAPVVTEQVEIAEEEKEEIKEVFAAEDKHETAKVNSEVELLKEQNEIMRKQLEELKAQISNARPQVIQISNDTERVECLWLAPVANENEWLVADGLYGKITGKVGNFSVPKNEFSRLLDASTRKFIENRWLIILGGLNENERRMYGVDYKPGETLDKDAFMRMMDLGKQIIGMYENLCDASKEVVAKMYYEAWIDPTQKHKVKRDTVVAMHKIKAQPGFRAILDDMNKADAE